MLIGAQDSGFLLLLLTCLKQVQVMAQQSVVPETKGTTLFHVTTQNVPVYGTEEPCKGWFHGRNITLSSRSLDVFPPCLPSDIEALDLSNNSLVTITQPHLLKLSQLQRLDLKHNQIQDFYCGSDVLENLQYLDLSNNNVSDVPRCSKVQNLTWLSLARNPIFRIQNLAFNGFPNLVFLNLSYTRLGKISPGGFSNIFPLKELRPSNISSIEILDLSGTYLSEVPSYWSFGFSYLKELYLQNMMNIKTLEMELVLMFPRLKLLSCAGSSALASVSRSLFEAGSHLTHVDFENCNLTALPQWITGSAHLNLVLLGNPLACDCDIAWIVSEQINVTVIRANETLCRQEDGLEISLAQLHDGCQINKTASNNTIANSLIGSVLFTSTEKTRETTTVAIDSTTVTQKVEKNTDIITVFKQTPSVSDSFNGQPPSSTTQATTLLLGRITAPTKSFGESETATLFPGTSRFILPTSTKKSPVGQKTHPTTSVSTKPIISVPLELPEIQITDYYEDDTPQTTTVKSPSGPCDYNPCRHLQKECYELQRMTPCSCPGLSGDNVLPFPPRIQEASEITDTSAQIHWCAPNSEVRKYQLIYHPEGDKNQTVVDNIYITSRKYTIYNLAPDTTYHICAVSFNRAGSSQPLNDGPSRSPCTEFRTKPSYVGILAALCTVAGVSIVGIIVLSVCLYKVCRKKLVNQYDTRLVSYKNPAFEYHLNIPSYN
ncbi:leucine-rich repeat neuronal protein 4 [Xenopus laevis]|uniref:Fibronectin type-III domain-containing protein n=2 Tax=Xenopus laevis TaxID=8355 RepID=A0A974HH73_XENLA|nr:leucine-rich repeat neuronal protein 4 [Xenopus laevis]OCT77718.1 hypothetical protein XELAEV_18028812mg [Xenopus laevis]